MTHPKLLKFMRAHKMYPRRKTVESCFILFQMVVKLFLILKIKMFLKIYLIKWHNLEKLSKLLINNSWKTNKMVVKIFAKSTLKDFFS